MNQLAHYALIGTMVASVIGALLICVLVSLYGFAVSSEGQPHRERRRRSITRFGHAAAGSSFGIAAVLAVLALATSTSSGSSLPPEFQSLTGSLSGRANSVMAVLHQIGSTADRLRARLERFGDADDGASNETSATQRQRPRGAARSEAARTDERPRAAVRASEVTDAVANDAPASVGSDAARERSAQPTPPPPASAVAGGTPPTPAAPARRDSSAVATGSRAPAGPGPSVQPSATSLPERKVVNRIEAPARVLPPPRRPGRSTGGADASIASRTPPPLAVMPSAPAPEPMKSVPKADGPGRPPAEAVVSMPPPAPAQPAPSTPAPPSPPPPPVVAVPPIATVPPNAAGSAVPSATPPPTIAPTAPAVAPAPTVSPAPPAQTLMGGGRVQPFEGGRSGGSADRSGPRLERATPPNVGDTSRRSIRTRLTNPDRAPLTDRTDPADPIDRSQRIDKVDKPLPVDKIDKPQPIEKVEKPQRVEKVEKPQRVEKVEKPQRPERIEKPERRGRN